MKSNKLAILLLIFGCSTLTISCKEASQKSTLEKTAMQQIEDKSSIVKDSIITQIVTETQPLSTTRTIEQYTITFAEWQDKSTNVTCIVIQQDSLFTIINDGSINGKKDEVIDSGILRIHKKTGKTILSKNPEDVNSLEIGGCSDGPTVIDLENKIIEFC